MLLAITVFDWSKLPLHGYIVPLVVLFVIMPLWGMIQFFRGPSE